MPAEFPLSAGLHKAGIDIGEDVVSPYLWSRSIKHLDVVAMTHAHEDHMGGMSAVSTQFSSTRTLDRAPLRTVRNGEAFARPPSGCDITIRPSGRGAPFAFGGATFAVAGARARLRTESNTEERRFPGDAVEFGRTSFLLTGDMEKKIEEQLPLKVFCSMTMF